MSEGFDLDLELFWVLNINTKFFCFSNLDIVSSNLHQFFIRHDFHGPSEWSHLSHVLGSISLQIDALDRNIVFLFGDTGNALLRVKSLVPYFDQRVHDSLFGELSSKNAEEAWLDAVHHSVDLILSHQYGIFRMLVLYLACDLLLAHGQNGVDQLVHCLICLLNSVRR